MGVVTQVGSSEIQTHAPFLCNGKRYRRDWDRRRMRALVDCREDEWEEAVT